MSKTYLVARHGGPAVLLGAAALAGAGPVAFALGVATFALSSWNLHSMLTGRL